ncbi:unnamed protein product, partial [Didymodactylos carnosus]
VIDSKIIDPTTNLDYVYLGLNQDGYRLYKLTLQSNYSAVQYSRANRLIEDYLQRSFNTPSRPYTNIILFCSNMFVFLPPQSSSLQNISALIMANTASRTNYICYVSTLSEHRRHGLGTQLLNEMIKESRRTVDEVSLHVNTVNTDAIPLYLKCGFRCDQYLQNYYFGDNTYPTKDAYYMTLKTLNIKNVTEVCKQENAVQIPTQEEANYKQRCPMNNAG